MAQLRTPNTEKAVKESKEHESKKLHRNEYTVIKFKKGV